MTDDTNRVLASLRDALDGLAAVRAAWPEAPAVCPSAVVGPARSRTLCAADGEALLTGVELPERLAARSFCQLLALAGRTEAAMRALGYRMAGCDPGADTSRKALLVFRAAFDENGTVYPQDEIREE